MNSFFYVILCLFRGRPQLTPVGFLSHNALEGFELVMRNAWLFGTDGCPTLLHGLGRLEHLATELDDRQVARAQPVMGAIGDRSHGFPHGDVLVGDPLDAGKTRAQLHDPPILPVVVLAGAELTETLIDIDTDLRAQELAPGLRIRCGGSVAPGDEVKGGVGVVDRHVQNGDVVLVVRWNLHGIGGNE